ncbi:unnamed protein product [Adineta steineri]|uniref:G-protein coupled receptors family 1 profile domain-containing protein n=1 Tax=Adineta steineri TaxID=433720 RepID=A0A815ZNA6_9BILA|nr:unnamed protein product [Adineta steineri]CAF1585676.1 unnamed protein product [Adineta steineri]
MLNSSFLLPVSKNIMHSLINNEWTQPALASCHILKWIGGCLCFIFIFGIILNSFILCVLLNKKQLQSPINLFIVALSSVDLIHALFGIPLPLTSNFACQWLYGKYLCYYEGFIAYSVGMIGLYLLTALSLNRYWIIVTPVQSKYSTFQTIYVSIFLAIVGGLFWAIVPMFGWNYYTLEGVLTSCSVRWQDRTLNVISYNICMFLFGYIVPLFILIFCNTKIYLEVFNVSKRSSKWGNCLTRTRSRRKQELEKHVAKTVIFIIVTFTIAWTPYASVAFISSFFSPTLISPLGGTLPAIFAKSSICFNPLVFILTNSHIQSTVFQQKKKTSHTSESTSSKNKIDQRQSLRLQLLPVS